jgi:excisionase family DNA binding protein
VTGLDADDLADRVADRVAERLAELPDDRPLLRAVQVAVRLGVSERTARDLIDRGVLASFKVAGARVVDPAEVDRYVAEQRAKA